MTLAFVNSGDTLVGNIIVGNAANEPLRMGLYVNSQAVSGATAISSLTELSGGGYAKKDLVPSSWATTLGPPNFVQAPEQLWTFTASLGNVHGYFLVGSTSGKLYAGEQFSDGPYNIVRSGDVIGVTPKITIA